MKRLSASLGTRSHTATKNMEKKPEGYLKIEREKERQGELARQRQTG